MLLRTRALITAYAAIAIPFRPLPTNALHVAFLPRLLHPFPTLVFLLLLSHALPIYSASFPHSSTSSPPPFVCMLSSFCLSNSFPLYLPQFPPSHPRLALDFHQKAIPRARNDGPSNADCGRYLLALNIRDTFFQISPTQLATRSALNMHVYSFRHTQVHLYVCVCIGPDLIYQRLHTDICSISLLTTSMTKFNSNHVFALEPSPHRHIYYICAYTLIYINVCFYMYIMYVYVYLYMSIYMYVYEHVNTHMQTGVHESDADVYVQMWQCNWKTYLLQVGCDASREILGAASAAAANDGDENDADEFEQESTGIAAGSGGGGWVDGGREENGREEFDLERNMTMHGSIRCGQICFLSSSFRSFLCFAILPIFLSSFLSSLPL